MKRLALALTLIVPAVGGGPVGPAAALAQRTGVGHEAAGPLSLPGRGLGEGGASSVGAAAALTLSLSPVGRGEGEAGRFREERGGGAIPGEPVERLSSVIRVELLDGRTHVAPLADGSEAKALRLVGPSGVVEVRMDEVLSIDFQRPMPYRPPNAGVVLRTGDRLTARVGPTEGREVAIDTALFGPVRVALDQVAALVLSPGVDSFPPGPPGVLLANGTFVAGTLRWLTEKALAVDSPVLGLVEVPRERVLACRLAPALRRATPDRSAEVRCANGDLVTGRLTDLDLKALGIEVAGVGRTSVPLASVERLRFLGGRARPLTDLAPVATKTVPFFDTVQPPRLGTSLEGRPLRIGQRQYAAGWGVESRTELLFHLDGQYEAFRADIGIDEEVGEGGNVVFQVELDGRPAYTSGPITGAMEAVPVRLKVSGVKTMRLIVDFGEDAHVRDHADWGEPVLIAAE